jgi:hypothetical protein
MAFDRAVAGRIEFEHGRQMRREQSCIAARNECRERLFAHQRVQLRRVGGVEERGDVHGGRSDSPR